MDVSTVQIKKEFDDLSEGNPDLVNIEDYISTSLIENNSTNNLTNNSFCSVNVNSEFENDNENNSTTAGNQFDTTSETDDEIEDNVNCKTNRKIQSKKRFGNKEWRCEVCDEGFTGRRPFRTHMLTHTKDKPYVCHICGKGFLDSSDLKPHMATHSEEYPFECDQCDMKFKVKWTLTEHSQTHENKEYQCGICLKTLKSRKSLRLHVKQLHSQPGDEGQNEKMHSCDQCGKTYKRPNGLKSHMRQHTNDMFRCHVCDKLFFNRSNLRIHLRTHTGEKPFECEICNEKFICMSRLKSHKSTHNRQFYKCNLCDKVFSSKSGILTHQALVHSTEEKHQCGLCEKKFKLRFLLMKHTREYHSESVEACQQADDKKQNQQTTFKCHICDKEYLRENCLLVHLKVHTEEPKFYKCEICGKKFERKCILDCHEKTHQKSEKTYKCDLCNRGYMIYGHLRRHRREKHSVEEGNHDTEPKVSVCEICHADCSAEGLEVHMSTHDLKPFKCECSGVFFSESDYKKHLKDDCEVVKGGLKLVDDVKMENDVEEELEIGFEGVKREYDD